MPGAGTHRPARPDGGGSSSGVPCQARCATDGAPTDSRYLTTMRSKTAESAARRLRLPFATAAVLLVLLLGVFAYALASSQHQQRQDINRRFEDRAKVAATVNESLFALASSSTRPTDSQRFGGKTVPRSTLQQRTAVQQQYY